MKKFITITLLLLVGLATAQGISAQTSPLQILGIRFNTTEDQVHKRLKEIGSFVREEEHQEVWQVRDESFSHLIVGFGQKKKLRFVTAVAREDKEAKRVEYAKIGDLKKARQAGDPKINNFNYEWDMPAGKGSPHTLIIAIGRDAKFLSTYSLKNLDAQPVKD